MTRLLAILVALALFPSAALGQQEAPEKDPEAIAAAEALFREGRRLMESGRLEKACKSFEKSLEIDRAIGTLWHLGRCYEETGRHASAYGMFAEVAGMAKALDRTKQFEAAVKRAQALEPRLCKLKVAVETTPLDEISVKIDGEVMPKGMWDTPIPIDCGKKQIEVVKNGRAAKTTVSVDKPGGVVAVDAPMPGKKVAATVEEPAKKPPSPAGWYSDWVGWSLVAGGLISGGAAVVMWSRADSLEQDAREPSLDLGVRDERFDDADTARAISLAAGAAGAALIVGGAIKLGMHSPERPVAGTVVPTVGGAKASLWFRF